MKKILLSLGSISLVGLPILMFSSCSSETQDQKLNIKLLSEQTTVSQKTIDDFWIKYPNVEESTESLEIKNNKKISLLSSVFIGVSVDNLLDFVVSETTEEINKTITLTATKGNVFMITDVSGKLVSSPTLIAKASPTPTKSLAISLKVDTTRIEIDKAISEFNKSITEDGMVAALIGIFPGITTTDLKPVNNINPLKISVVENSDREVDGKIIRTLGTITLIASPDYYFTSIDNTSLQAKAEEVDVQIKSKTTPVTQQMIDEAVLAVKKANELPSEEKEAALLIALNPIFEGITQSSIKNITVESFDKINAVEAHIILKTIPGYVFDVVSGEITLTSKVIA